MGYRLLAIVATAVVILTGTVLHSLAATINGVVTIVGPVSSPTVLVLPTASPNNDNDGPANPNGVSVFNGGVNAVGPIDIVFGVDPSGGVTEYRVDDNIFNRTGVEWTNFRLELGFGTGASFVRASAASGLDFNVPLDVLNGDALPSAFVLNASIFVSANTIDFTGSLLNGTSEELSFAIDVPDLPASANNMFTLRQTPNITATAAVPEPSTLMLLSAGLLATALRLRRNR
jgi:hypothetical protein